MALVTLAAAKVHLHVTTDDRDDDIQMKVNLASAIVLDYLKSRADVTWTDETVPLPVAAAVLLMIGHLDEHRGDDAAGTFRAPDVAIWDAIALLLYRFRDPALA